MKPTSMMVYRLIQANGTLTNLQHVVYSALLVSGPVTANELMEKARREHPEWTISMISNFEKRLSELRTQSMVRELPRRQCTVSGHQATVWEAIPTSSFEGNGQALLFEDTRSPAYSRGH